MAVVGSWLERFIVAEDGDVEIAPEIGRARSRNGIAVSRRAGCCRNKRAIGIGEADGDQDLDDFGLPAMVDLGLGKNMVRAARFWAQAAGMAAPISRSAGHKPTDLGSAILGHRGFDPFLEDIRTLWLIHWNLSTNIQSPLLAWDYLLNRWQEPDLVPTDVLKGLQKEASKQAAE